MTNALRVLVERGLDPTGYDTPVPLAFWADHIHHGQHGCSRTAGLPALGRAHLSPLSVENLCPCWIFSLKNVVGGGALYDTLMVAAALEHHEDRLVWAEENDPLRAVQFLQEALPELQDLGEKALLSWRDGLRERIEMRIQEIRATFQTPEARSELLAWCRGDGRDLQSSPTLTAQSPSVGFQAGHEIALLGLHDLPHMNGGRDPHQVRRLHSIKEAWHVGTKHKWDVVCAPREAARVLRQYLGRPSLPEPGTVILDTDTPATLETALALWEPLGAGAFHKFGPALEAARHL